jgi:hypothetical protein
MGEYGGGVGQHAESDTELTHRRRLLEHDRRDTLLVQAQRSGQSTAPAPHDLDRCGHRAAHLGDRSVRRAERIAAAAHMAVTASGHQS